MRSQIREREEEEEEEEENGCMLPLSHVKTLL
jgi:hypothetical protein